MLQTTGLHSRDTWSPVCTEVQLSGRQRYRCSPSSPLQLSHLKIQISSPYFTFISYFINVTKTTVILHVFIWNPFPLRVHEIAFITLSYNLFKLKQSLSACEGKLENLNWTTSVPKRSLFSVLAKQKLILDSPGRLRPPCSLDKLKNNEIQGFERTARTVKKVLLTLNK